MSSLTAQRILQDRVRYRTGEVTPVKNIEAFAVKVSQTKRSIRLRQTYRTRSGARVAWFQVASETQSGIVYDVVLSFGKTSGDLLQAPLQVFSNSPFFAYHMAHVCEDNGWLFADLRTKFERKVRRNAPTKNNPDAEFLSDKTIILALMKLEATGFNSPVTFDRARPVAYNSREFVRGIPSARDVERIRKSAKPKKIKDDRQIGPPRDMQSEKKPSTFKSNSRGFTSTIKPMSGGRTRGFTSTIKPMFPKKKK